MTVLQHELQYLVISFQQASVTSIELSKREKPHKTRIFFSHER